MNSGSLEQIMRELAQKDAEIEVLKQTQSQSSSVVEKAIKVDVSGYVEKIRDLEGKLKEYEIIEDDIADLSHFKEENAKLKKKIEELGGSVTVDSSAPEAVEKSKPSVVSADPQ
jgi:phage shock protein A